MSLPYYNIYGPTSHTLIFFLTLIILPYICALGGSWQLLQENVGISAMHMQLLSNDRVIMFDRTNFGPSNLSLPFSHCRHNPLDRYLPIDCTSHSAEYNTLTNSIRPLNIITDTWCSSGVVLSNGHLVQTGGYNDGERVVRTFEPNSYNTVHHDSDWEEIPNALLQHRWYATDHVLPDGTAIILGGRRAFSYEFFPKTPSASTSPTALKLTPFPFLGEVNDPGVENNLYPFVFLNVDGNLFVFANNRAILFNYKTNEVVRTYPTVPGGDPRNYPSTGSAVLLPIPLGVGDKVEAEVLICGGAHHEAYGKAIRGEFLAALNTCARMKITDPNPRWAMETMPMPRTMGDMVILPNGDVLIINGAQLGTAGWELGRDPALTPIIYHPHNVLGSRFEVTNPSTIPRMYHSCAILLRDGRVMVGGSNPHQFYNFTNVLFPTDLTLEAFLPPYMDPTLETLKPYLTSADLSTIFKYAKIVKIKFAIKSSVNLTSIKVTLVRPPFNTHSFSMSQRLIVLTNTTAIKQLTHHWFQLQVRTPGSSNIAPPGYYMLFLVHQDVPSHGIWVKIV